jgi:hypothetical protein
MMEFVDPAKECGEFTIVAVRGEMGIDYTCYECTALSVPNMIPHYLERGWNSSLDLTARTDEAEWYLKAFIRDDGFTSLDFNQDEDVLQFQFTDFDAKMYRLLDKLRDTHKRLILPKPEFGLPKELQCPSSTPPPSSENTSTQP